LSTVIDGSSLLLLSSMSSEKVTFIVKI